MRVMRRLKRWWLRWWLRRWLHDDCVEWEAMLTLGYEAPMGACVSCSPRIAKLRAMSLPAARVAP